MNTNEVMTRLESLGTAQTRKTYGRHGIIGPMYGVKYGDLYKLVKEVKGDHDLGLDLWQTGNMDARVLATLIVDPSRMTMKTLSTWLKDVDHHGLSSILSNVAQRSPKADKLMHKWMASRKELVATTGWLMLCGIARENSGLLTDVEYAEFLTTIEKDIHQAQNRVKHAMNLALISVGAYIDEKGAVTIAKRIGPVDVDHGDTSCKTQLAAPYIQKAAAHHRAKLAKKAAKRTTKKRSSKKG